MQERGTSPQGILRQHGFREDGLWTPRAWKWISTRKASVFSGRYTDPSPMAADLGDLRETPDLPDCTNRAREPNPNQLKEKTMYYMTSGGTDARGITRTHSCLENGLCSHHTPGSNAQLTGDRGAREPDKQPPPRGLSARFTM